MPARVGVQVRWPAERLLGGTVLALALVLGCGGEGEQKIRERDGVRYVSNGEGAAQSVEQLEVLWEVGSESGADFGLLRELELDDDGTLYALDEKDQVLARMSASGSLQATIGGNGQGPGELSKSKSFVLVGDRIYLANEGNGRIEVFSTAGESLDQIKLAELSRPGQIHYRAPYFYVGRRFAHNGYYLYRYDESWQLSARLKPSEPIEDPYDELRTFHMSRMGPDGIWIVYIFLNKIQKLDWDGNLVLEVTRDLAWEPPRDTSGKVKPEVPVHRQAAVDPDGNLYVIYTDPDDPKRSSDVYKYRGDGTLAGKAFTLPIHTSRMIHFDREGHLFFSNGLTLYKARIQPATTRGARLETPRDPHSTG